MANAPEYSVKRGSINGTVWSGSYKGEATRSFNIKKQKFNKETKQWEDSPFLNVSDLKDIRDVARLMCDWHYDNPVGKNLPDF